MSNESTIERETNPYRFKPLTNIKTVLIPLELGSNATVALIDNVF